MFDVGCIVRAEAGRDKEDIFCVVGVDQARNRLLLANGKGRRLGRPKEKSPRHVIPLTDHLHGFDHPTIGKLKQKEPVTDRELRQALAAFKEGNQLG